MVHPVDHPVSRYARDVLDGKIIAGRLVELAAERHLRDLETGADRGFYFDTQAADMICNFAKMLRHTTGALAGKPMELQPWQVFRHGCVFGWKREADGLRRFSTTYHQVAKKNGKTTDTAPPMIFATTFDGEAAAQGYCAATTRDQAKLLFGELKRMIRASPAMSRICKPWQSSITVPRTNSMITTLSRDGNAADGINPHFAARDEVHRWTDRELAEVVVNSMIARSQPIDWMITTAGADRNTICGEARQYSEQVLRGDVQDDKFFAYVAEPEESDDPGDPKTWAKGNPNLGVSVPLETFASLWERAQVIQGQMPNFRRLHLNLWTEGEQTWISRDVWDRGAEPFNPEMLFGRKAWIGIDLSRTTDLTSIAVAVPMGGLIYVICYTFIPEGPKGFIVRAQTENRAYVDWRDRNWLEVHRGSSIDEDAVIERMKWLRSKFEIQEVAFDRWGMKYVAKELDKLRFPMVEHGQGYASMSAPTKRLEECVLNGRIRHGGNPVLAWAIGNVILDTDAAENVKPNKKKAKNRIDPGVATIMAVGRAEAGQGTTKKAKAAVV